MGPVACVLLGSLLLAIFVRYGKTALSHPRKVDIRLILDHNGRKIDPSLIYIVFDTVAFFTAGLFLVHCFRNVGSSFQATSLASLAAFLSIFLVFLSNLTLGKARTVALFTQSGSSVLVILPLLMWLVLLPNAIELVPHLDPSDFPLIANTLHIHIAESLIFCILAAASFAHNYRALMRLRGMSTEIDSFIHNHFDYPTAITFLRDSAKAIYPTLNPALRRRVPAIVHDNLVECIHARMRDEESLKQHFVQSKIHNYVYYGIWSETPVCVIICVNRLLSVIGRPSLLQNNRRLVAMLQYLRSTHMPACVGFYCVRAQKSFKAKASVDDFVVGEKIAVSFRIKRFLGDAPAESMFQKNEKVSVSEDHLIWVGL